MDNHDILEEISSLGKKIKVQWEKLQVEYNEKRGTIKDNVREFKSVMLIPILDKIVDLGAVIIESRREDLYHEIGRFFKNMIDLSTMYRVQKGTSIRFNLSSGTEQLGSLLPAYEATVRMHILGAIAIAERDFNFISKLGDQKVVSHENRDGEKINMSIYFFPWFTDGYGAGNLTTFFEEAKIILSGDKFLIERYFSPLKDIHINALCQFDFLQCIKLELLQQIRNDMGYYRFPNFGRYPFDRVDEIIQRIINQDDTIIKDFPISVEEFRRFMKEYVSYIQEDFRAFGPYWHLDLLPKHFVRFISQ